MKLKLIILFFVLGVNFTYSQNACNSAITVTVNGSCNTGNIIATGNTFEAPAVGTTCMTNVANARDRWFIFTAIDAITTISLTTATTGRDLAIVVYSATCSSGLLTPATQIGCADNVVGYTPQTESITLTTLTPGTQYHIRAIGTRSTSAANFSVNLCVRSPVKNDDPTGATALTTPTNSCSYIGASLINATKTTCGGISNPSCGSYGSSSVDVWFSVEVPASGDLFLQTLNGGAADLGMATYTGTPCSSLTEIGCSAGNPEETISNNPSIYVTSATPSSTVYVRVWNKDATSLGTFSICATTFGPCGNDLSVGGNDYCENPYAIFTAGATSTMTATNYTVGSPSYTEDVPANLSPNSCASPIYNAWYSFVPTTSSVSFSVETGSCEVDFEIFETALNQYGCCKNFVPLSVPSVTAGDCSPSTWSVTASTSTIISASALTPGNTYYMMVNYPSGVCTFTITGWAYSGILPVDMLLFNATNDNLKNSITWVIANEKGVKQYVLQKSKDGVNFEDFDWLASKGITTEKNTYYATDGKPYELTYYRLKIIYQQGNEKYTNIISVNIANSIDNLQSVYPNPTTADLYFEYYLKHAGNIQVSLVDYAGKIAFDTTYQLTEGKNKLTLPMSSFENGVYILKVVAEKSGKTTYHKVVKN